MRDENRALRQEQIEHAAYELLELKGYSGTSMQGIARRARASNETLYNWYGDKHGLFKALVTRNAADVKLLLEVPKYLLAIYGNPSRQARSYAYQPGWRMISAIRPRIPPDC